MSTSSFENIHSSIRNMRRLPVLREADHLNRRTLNSSPAKLLATPESSTRKKLESSSNQKRVASMPKKPKKSTKEFESTFSGPILLSKTQSRNMLFISPKKFMGRNAKLTKLETPKPKNSPPSDTFTERYQQLQLQNILPNAEESRSSQKAHGIARAFGVCTNQGLVRNYNEDRVSIVLEIPKPISKPDYETWPNCSIFAIFDGHGGSKCADFLRSSLHYYIARNKWFPTDPEEALKEACEAVERRFIENQLTCEEGKHDTSGSCGLVMVVVEDTCYISNIGDSRAVISRNGGKIRQAVTRDHKPSDELERTRVLNAGGRVYQNFPSVPNSKLMNTTTNGLLPVAAGPHRILPGGLAVSRAFGDIEAKIPKFGGNSNVLIAKPEITTLKINRSVDFIVMGSDGIFDVMSNDEVIRCVWNTINKEEAPNMHELLRIASENVIKEALLKKSFDNVTVIIVGFPALEQKLNPSIPVQASVEMTQGLVLSPKIASPVNTEGTVPEAGENNGNNNTSMEKLYRSERLTSYKIGNASRTLSKNSSKKDLLTTRIKEMSKRELESLPKIIPRTNSIRPSRLSAL